MKYLILLPVLFATSFLNSQEKLNDSEIPPVFPECEMVEFQQRSDCFRETLKDFIVENIKIPQVVEEDNFRGTVVVLFEVTKEGDFQVLYIDAAYNQLKEEIIKVFESLPQIRPATYNGKPTYMQFRMPLKIPLRLNEEIAIIKEESTSWAGEAAQDKTTDSPFTGLDANNVTEEYDLIQSSDFTKPHLESKLNIPFSHEMYSRFDAELNRIGTNTHTSSKPFLYSEVARYYDFKAEQEKILQDRSTWLGRKIWNEHLVQFQTEDYWFTIDFGLDLQLGKDFQQEDYKFTYNNTRMAILNGGLGDNLNFYAVAYENQGRFAEYFNDFAQSIRPDGGDPAIIPGRGIAKPFMDGGYDYPVAEGYLSYSPGKYFNIQLGHGQHFIGDGYRSLLMSDNPSPYPYLKLSTTFWKLKYTNTWMSLRDVRPEVTADGSFRTKFMANHYLSLNLTKRLNVGLFESVVWQNDNNRGFDVNYLNPVIFYRAIEFSTGARGGNALLGLTTKYKWTDKINTYGQWVIDEFSTGDIFGGSQSWKNKLGYQLGVKYFDAFNIPNLLLQMEYNQVRPYTYSHNKEVVLNYGHNNQSMAHLWGANFREIIGIARYKKERMYGHVKFIYGKRGFDFNNGEDNAAYGGDIYRNYNERPFDYGVKIGQGNTTNSLFAEVEGGYIINPASNLKLYGKFIYRNFETQVKTPLHSDNSTAWINFGLRTDIFNWYYDY
ncbi:gliding motility protein RemB [Salegentibacter sp. F188]|uniref:Gliding motility protein RemB n=1 Tax=Autumnicola patrickiae TaxID=3075591 RepID=A0ABU3DZY9_9FLAO|nr:gliding motility protein RemB [Salegentibacter sp. F188]MDT0689300.1 gliding motility protein RemB [Salegentibacter sp. F188]